ncbi:hypothetical protein B0H13DRAFT_1874021 [Mycena leptocephala]|nr:hypothetical protein B0H13DRAFT_1874021 [Mycena leptocephala]
MARLVDQDGLKPQRVDNTALGMLDLAGELSTKVYIKHVHHKTRDGGCMSDRKGKETRTHSNTTSKNFSGGRNARKRVGEGLELVQRGFRRAVQSAPYRNACLRNESALLSAKSKAHLPSGFSALEGNMQHEELAARSPGGLKWPTSSVKYFASKGQNGGKNNAISLPTWEGGWERQKVGDMEVEDKTRLTEIEFRQTKNKRIFPTHPKAVRPSLFILQIFGDAIRCEPKSNQNQDAADDVKTRRGWHVKMTSRVANSKLFKFFALASIICGYKGSATTGEMNPSHVHCDCKGNIATRSHQSGGTSAVFRPMDSGWPLAVTRRSPKLQRQFSPAAHALGPYLTSEEDALCMVAIDFLANPTCRTGSPVLWVPVHAIPRPHRYRPVKS